MVVRGFADAVDLLLNPDILSRVDVMDFYRRVASLYDAQDYKAPVTTLVRILEDHGSSYFAQAQTHITGYSRALPPKRSVIGPQLNTLLQMHKDELAETVRGKVSPAHGRGRTGLRINYENAFIYAGKTVAIDKTVHKYHKNLDQAYTRPLQANTSRETQMGRGTKSETCEAKMQLDPLTPCVSSVAGEDTRVQMKLRDRTTGDA